MVSVHLLILQDVWLHDRLLLHVAYGSSAKSSDPTNRERKL